MRIPRTQQCCATTLFVASMLAGAILAADAPVNTAAEQFRPIGGDLGKRLPRWVPGKVGTCLQFDGAGDNVNCGHAGGIAAREELTIAFWVYANEWTHTAQILARGGVLEIRKRLLTGGGVYFWIYLDRRRLNAIWDKQNFMKLSAQEWYHIAFTYDSKTGIARSYLNGRPHSSRNLRKEHPDLKSYALPASRRDLVFGSPGRGLNGKLDEVYFYSRVLSPEEIARVYANRDVPKEGLAGCWRFKEGKGNVAGDTSGHGNAGQISLRRGADELPNLGGPVNAQILRSDPNTEVWLQNATAKVMHADRPKPSEPNPVIEVALARNEYEPFQIVLRPKRPLQGVRLSFSELTQGADRLGRDRIRWRLVRYIPIDSPSDTGRTGGKDVRGEAPVIYTQTAKPGWYPDPLPEVRSFDATEDRNYPLWVEVHAPAGARPGVYQGKATLNARGIEPIELTLRVQVRSFRLPEVFHTRNAAPFRDRFGGKDLDLREVARNFAEHHFAIEPIWSQPELTFRGTEAFIDTTEFDKTASYLIDELKMNNFFFPRTGLYFMAKARDAVGRKWYGFTLSDKCGELRPDFLAALTSYIHKMSEHLRSKGWFDKFRVSLVDEPHKPESFAIIRQASRAIRKLEPDLPIYETKWPLPELIGHVDVWCLGFFQPSGMKAALERGERLEWYPNWHPLIDRPGMNTRMIGWNMWKNGITGILLWSTQHHWSGSPRAAWLSPCLVYPNGRVLWGSGSFFYPGEGGRLVNSIRWELLREALEDYEYLKLFDDLCRRAATGGVPAAAEIAKEARAYLDKIPHEIVPYYEAREGKRVGWSRMAWETDPDKVYEARRRLAEYIESLTEALGR